MALVGLLLLGHSDVASAAVGWKAGVARAKITPVEPIWMAGYGNRDRPSEGTEQDLWLKALALEDAAGRRLVVVTTDLLGLPRQLSGHVTSRLTRRLGLPRDAVMLTSSHTHCGPVLRDALYDIYPLDDTERGKIEAYSAWLEDQMVETVVEAFARLAPASVAAGQGEAGFAVNRRENPAAEVPERRRLGTLAGPVDHSVPVLQVVGPEGKLLAVVFGYACHNTTLDNYRWCGDYAGFAQEALETAHPGAAAMFFSGCGADANPLPRRTLALCQDYGRQLADAVEKVLAGSLQPLEPRVHTAFSLVDLSLDELPTRADLQAQADSGNGYARRWASRLLGTVDRGRSLPRSYPYPVQVWKLGGTLTWIALGGEVVVDYSLRLKSELGESIWVAAYANDVMAYVPSLRVLKEGGYEGASSMRVYGLPTTWAPEVEERVVAEVHRLARLVD
jgi:hypothetical protein